MQKSQGAKVCKFSGRSRQELSNEYLVFACKIWRRYSRERASQNLPKIIQKFEKKVRQKLEKKARKNIAARQVR